MKRFTAILTDGDMERRLSFHSMYRRGSLLNRLDLKKEMMVWDFDPGRWNVSDIFTDERKRT